MRLIFVVLIAVFVGYCYNNYNEKIEDTPAIEDILSALPANLLAWYKRGQTTIINNREIFYIYEKCTNKNVQDPQTYVIVHGFPSSTYEYNKVIDKLLQHGNVFLHDHLGFGFSDGPGGDFTYSLAEAADNSLAIWRKIGIKEAHIVSHDMGDSIVAEILARHHRDLLPEYFTNFFKSVTFTNGGMKIRLANLRITQILCMNSEKACQLFTGLLSNVGSVRRYIVRKQLKSIWSATADEIEMEKDVRDLMAMNFITDKVSTIPKTFYYLWDRFHFEDRFYAGFPTTKIPLRFVWGDSDSVAPLTIPESFRDILPDLSLTVIKGAGHFWMLEQPDEWVKQITKKFK